MLAFVRVYYIMVLLGLSQEATSAYLSDTGKPSFVIQIVAYAVQRLSMDTLMVSVHVADAQFSADSNALIGRSTLYHIHAQPMDEIYVLPDARRKH